jgi:hypothetical protein
MHAAGQIKTSSSPPNQCHAPDSPADPSTPDHLDWFTTRIWPDHTQSVHIRPTESNSGDGQHVSENGQGMTSPDTPAIALNHSDSQLLMTILDRLAQDPGIPWLQARQAVLRGFWDTLSAR